MHPSGRRASLAVPEPLRRSGRRVGAIYCFRMPKRTTPFQAVVRMVREHYAQPGVTITESKFLRDAVTGVEREVDIVIEGEFDGEPMVVSAEVIEHKRPASLPWVEQMLRKHRDLATNRLLLVSKSGFSANALALIETEAGRVEAMTPELIEQDGAVVVKRLYVDHVDYSPTRCVVYVREGDDRIAVEGEPVTDVYGPDTSILGPLSYLVQDAVSLEPVRRALFVEAHNHPEKDKVTNFSLNLAIAQLGYHLQKTESGQLHRIEEVEIWGDFSVSQAEVPLTLASLGGRTYGAAEASIGGRPTAWVGTTDRAKQTTTISWQTTDAPGPPQPPIKPPVRPIHFAGLLTLFPSPTSGATDEAPAKNS
jgi:hypothetical protein